ncbi:uncharacterized protein A4U43_C03F8000 [Asparagus officinalis]|uniref:Magnesium transporter n=1 Tax=Asparagus officinalis TaxID=4686 RepID=A0A5P1F8D1_ASPOF|nr:magnesium transporter MRS2-3 [Asparagus officinalis]ONK74585.1 uncharacterized protein A4U43_C03F8000 [Asparagus officinalis]
MRLVSGSGAPRPQAPKPESEPEPISRLSTGARKKGPGTRPWMVVDSTGQAEVIEAGKHSIMNQTGLPGRDLRILDPLLSYPSTVLGRERAIVINLEHIKAIITAHEVLLLNFKDPAVAPFVQELQQRIQLHHEQREGMIGISTVGEGKFSKLRDLPFEFVALEACLEAACSCLENEATTLEKEAHPALDKLTTKISSLNLEHVRQIKSRLVAISGRVQKVRDELEQLLDDDDDMAEMYLTDKLLQQNVCTTGSSPHSSLDEDEDDIDDDERIPAEISSEDSYIEKNFEENSQNIGNHGHLFSRMDSNEVGRGTQTCSTISGGKRLNIEELEMLLEAYFVQIDSTLNNLSTLREYVDDTEDYINIMLDDKQNHLLQMGVVLTTATLIVSAFVVLAGIFGININNDLFDETKSGTSEWLWTVGGGATGSLFLYILAIAWCKHRRLLE